MVFLNNAEWTVVSSLYKYYFGGQEEITYEVISLNELPITL